MSEATRHLAALMLTDMVGYTRLMQRDEALGLRLIDEHNRLIQESVAAHGGRKIKGTGDGFLVEFPSALQAISCAVSLQRTLRDRNANTGEKEQFHIRIGLHVGDVVRRDDDIFGDGVNITSRIEPLATAGGICLSQAVHTQVWNKTNVDFESLGAQELKNIEAPMEVFRAVLPWEEYEKEEAKTPEGTRLAVLPLANISADADDAYFADGLTEELIFTLSRIPDLKVIAQTSVMPYKDQAKSIREIGGELKVGSILEGSVRKSGDRVRITLQLIDVGTEEHLWSERYDRQLENIFEIQDSIAEEVAAGLRTLLAVAPAPSEKKPTESIAAYDVYLRGRKWLQEEGEDALRKAIDFFAQALALDPEFATAHASLARSLALLLHRQYATPDEIPAIERKAFDAAHKAVSLAPDLDEAHSALGVSLWALRGDYVEAEREYRAALKLSPDSHLAHHGLAIVLHESGRLDEAFLHITRAKELDPLSSFSRYVRGNILMSMRRYDEARLEVLAGLDLDPDFAQFYQTLINAEVNLWNWQGVLDAAERALKRPSTEFFGIIAKVTGSWILGDRDTADEALDRLVGMSDRITGTRIYYTARLLYYAQRYEEAIAIYEKDPTEPRELAWRPLRLAYIRAVMGDLSRATQLLEEANQAAERLGGNFARPELFARNLLFYRGLVAALDGRSAEARELLDELEEHLQGRNLYYDVARLCFAIGDLDRGFELLNRAIAERVPDELAELPIDPLLDPYRDDPRFRAILGIMGLAGTASGRKSS